MPFGVAGFNDILPASSNIHRYNVFDGETKFLFLSRVFISVNSGISWLREYASSGFLRQFLQAQLFASKTRGDGTNVADLLQCDSAFGAQESVQIVTKL
jgi:hypothetical protein